jgi:hypothetical protein
LFIIAPPVKHRQNKNKHFGNEKKKFLHLLLQPQHKTNMSGIQCKDLVGSSVQIKNQTVIDTDTSLCVNNAKVKGDLNVKGSQTACDVCFKRLLNIMTIDGENPTHKGTVLTVSLDQDRKVTPTTVTEYEDQSENHKQSKRVVGIADESASEDSDQIKVVVGGEFQVLVRGSDSVERGSFLRSSASGWAEVENSVDAEGDEGVWGMATQASSSGSTRLVWARFVRADNED